MKNFLLPFLFLLITVSLRSQEYISIKNIETFDHLADSAVILTDDSSLYIFKDILFAKENELKFEQPLSEIPYMDFTTSTYWMKVLVKNDTSESETYYLELARPLTNVLNLYVFDENNELVKIYYGGDELPFSARPYLHRKFVIPVKFPANAKRTLIVKAKSDGEILKLPIKLWDVQAFTQFTSKENFFLGLYYGFFALVFILFSFFGVALKEKIYLYFVGYVLVFGLFQFSLDGLAYQYLWPNSPWFASHSILIFAAIAMLSLLSYANQFLKFYEEKKWFVTTYKFFFALVLLCLVSSFTNGIMYELTYPVLNGVSFITTFFFFIGIYQKYKAGHKPGLTIALAFIFLWAGAILFIASNVNLIQSEFLAANALKFGSAAEITFLSISLAARYRQANIEKFKAQKDANDRLEELNEIKVQQTAILEKQVIQRTQEIIEKNDILETKNKEIINSITYAKRLQDALLPSDKLLEACFIDSSILFQPKDIVSGDFYWLEATKNYVYFAVADCTGHGVPGAMVSVVGYNALNRCINELKLTDPGAILDKLTDLVEHTFTNTRNVVSDGMDICLCRWNYKSELKYSGAFNPLYIIRNKELIEIKGDKQPIGKFIKRSAFVTHDIKVEKDDSIILFSDGYADQFGGEKGKKLKYANFKSLLLKANELPTEEFSPYLSDFFIEWRGKEEQIDDVCLMKVKF